MESTDLYQDDLTDERQPTPAQRDDVARTLVLDPDVLDTADEDTADEDELEDEDDEDEDEDEAEDDVD
jgi:hypothetical protein